MKERLAEGKTSPRPKRADDDEPLVERVLEGDQGAFEEIVRRHERRVYRTTLAVTGNAEDAEEAMQDAFFKAYLALPEFRRESKFTSWLTRIAVNEALQICRRRHDTESIDEPVISEEGMMPRQVEDWHDNPEQLYAKQELRERVEQAIRSLRPAYRVAFVLHDVEGLGAEEVAEALNLTIPAAKSRILRARLMMREALAPSFQRPATLKSRILRVSSMLRMALSMKPEKPTGQRKGS